MKRRRESAACFKTAVFVNTATGRIEQCRSKVQKTDTGMTHQFILPFFSGTEKKVQDFGQHDGLQIKNLFTNYID